LGLYSGEKEGIACLREHAIQNDIRLALSKEGIVFRTNSGEFWQGKLMYSREFKQEVLINLTKVMGLPKGFSDLLFVGDGFVAFIETKTPYGIATEDQENFLARMRSLGHRAGIARSVAEAIDIIFKEG
jgi:hypothetical protein